MQVANTVPPSLYPLGAAAAAAHNGCVTYYSDFSLSVGFAVAVVVIVNPAAHTCVGVHCNFTTTAEPIVIKFSSPYDGDSDGDSDGDVDYENKMSSVSFGGFVLLLRANRRRSSSFRDKRQSPRTAHSSYNSNNCSSAAAAGAERET